MKVIVAGYNLDRSNLKLDSAQHTRTPETISAAYARISRSPKSVDELRAEASLDVDKARSSNQNIVFEMGHASVAEHAVFNFDIIGISRLLVESVQRSRLASFTEKSQRYVTLDGDYVIPAELEGNILKDEFVKIVELQNDLYRELYDLSRKYLKEKGFEGAGRELRGKAKEDARYVLPLATETQFGMTINARSLERLLQRLDRINLEEAKELKKQLQEKAKQIAPSLIRYTCCDPFETGIAATLPQVSTSQNGKDLELRRITENADDKILAGLIFEIYGGCYDEILDAVYRMEQSEKSEIYSRIFKSVKPWQVMPRAFELAEAEFSVCLSSSCFGQLKRHRMATIMREPYNINTGYVIPPLLKQIKADSRINDVMQQVEKLYYKLNVLKPGLGEYILSNGHKLRVIFKANLREFYHFTRLRSDGHAQWEIRELSLKIEDILKKKIPLAAQMLKGKDAF